MFTSQTARNNYTGNGAVDTYAYGFKIFSDDEILVKVRNTAGVEATLTKTTHYTVSGVGESVGGNVVLVNGAFDWLDGDGDLKSGYTLSIRRKLPIKQATDLRNQGSYFPEDVEDQLDKLAMIDLQQQDEVDRSVKLPETIPSSSFSPTLPTDLLLNGASKVPMLNDAGTGFADADEWPTGDEVANAQAYAVAADASADAAAASEAAAAASAAAAATAETNAETAETNAETAETNAETAQAAAEAAQAAAEAAQAAAETAETNAETAETNAETAETNAETAATNAAASAAAALTSENNAATSETNAATSETNAAASETAAAASAASAAGAVAAHEADTTNIHGITDTSDLLTTSNTKVVTNKDIDGGTASNNSRVTLPKAAKATLDGLNRKEGTVWYASDEDKIYFDDGANLRQVGSGAGGGLINYISNPDAEAGTTGWSAYADAAATRPVDGTGGSPNVTWTRTTSSPLRGTGSFLLTKDAVNRQGEGVSYPFTIDAADKAKMLGIEIDFIVGSGTFAAGSPSSESDLIVYIYDVTNSRLIEPSNIKFFSNSAVNPDRFIASFQSAPDSTSYRLILHCASTSASAYTVLFDNFRVGPASYSYGSPVVDLGTETWADDEANATTSVKLVRIGNRIFAEGLTTVTGVINASGSLDITIPSKYSLDTTWYTFSGKYWDLGRASLRDANGASLNGSVWTNAATTLSIFSEDSGSASLFPGSLNATTPFTWASGDSVQWRATWYVSGWAAATQMSDTADTRVLAFKGEINTTVNNTTPTLSLTKVYDTHGAYTTSTFTAPSYGRYRISGYIRTASAAWTAGNAIEVYYAKNGGGNTIIGRVNPPAGTFIAQAALSEVVELNAGDTLVFKAYSDVSNSSAGIINVDKMSGPSAIAAMEIIAASYASTAGNSLTTAGGNQIVDFATKEIDTHNAVTTGAAWKFTAPAAGIYEIRTTLTFSSASLSAGTSAGCYVFKNGSVDKFIGSWDIDATRSQAKYLHSAACLVQLNAGDYIDIRQNVPVNTTLDNSVGFNWVQIKRAG